MSRILAWRAWHGDPALKAAAVARMHAHRQADAITQGAYAFVNEVGGFRGCLHGCLTTDVVAAEQGLSIARAIVWIEAGYHAETERLFGIPVAVGAILDKTFEALAPAECAAFAVSTLEAIEPGADLALVPSAVMYDVLADSERGLLATLRPSDWQAGVVRRVAALYRRRLDGDDPTRQEWMNEAVTASSSPGLNDRVAEFAHQACCWATIQSATPMFRWLTVLSSDGDTETYATWLAARIIHHLAAAPVPVAAPTYPARQEGPTA